MRIEAIIFDMDGLMVDTEPLSQQAWHDVLADYGAELDDALYRRMIGYRTSESAQMVVDTFALSVSAADLAREKLERYEQIRAQGIPEMPGLRQLLAAVAERGLRWAVATSSPRHIAEANLRDLGLLDDCPAIAAGDEVAHGKPAPDIYELAAARVAVAPEHCLALEDSAPGVEAAVAAGMVAVAVPNRRPPDDFPHAHHVLPSLHHVAANLDDLLVR